MRRAGYALALAAAATTGCLTSNPFRVGNPPDDKDAEAVSVWLQSGLQAAFVTHARGDGWEAWCVAKEANRNGGEQTFTWRFTGKPHGYDPKVHPLVPLTKDERRRVLDCIQVDVLNTLRATGVEITITQPATPCGKGDQEARSEIRYLRKNREVAGEIFGHIRPVENSLNDGLTVMTFTVREFWCK
jgi:hypothetical protein